jgi:hypothetical protein
MGADVEGVEVVGGGVVLDADGVCSDEAGAVGFVTVLVSGRGAGCSLEALSELWPQPATRRVPTTATTPKRFFIWLLSSHKKQASAIVFYDAVDVNHGP